MPSTAFTNHCGSHLKKPNVGPRLPSGPAAPPSMAVSGTPTTRQPRVTAPPPALLPHAPVANLREMVQVRMFKSRRAGDQQEEERKAYGQQVASSQVRKASLQVGKERTATGTDWARVRPDKGTLTTRHRSWSRTGCPL